MVRASSQAKVKEKSPQTVLQALLKKRFFCAELIGSAKFILHLPIHEPQLEKNILESVKKQALREALDESFVVTFFSDLFEKSRRIQMKATQEALTPTLSRKRERGNRTNLETRRLLIFARETIREIDQEIIKTLADFMNTQ